MHRYDPQVAAALKHLETLVLARMAETDWLLQEPAALSLALKLVPRAEEGPRAALLERLGSDFLDQSEALAKLDAGQVRQLWMLLAMLEEPPHPGPLPQLPGGGGEGKEKTPLTPALSPQSGGEGAENLQAALLAKWADQVAAREDLSPQELAEALALLTAVGGSFDDEALTQAAEGVRERTRALIRQGFQAGQSDGHFQTLVRVFVAGEPAAGRTALRREAMAGWRRPEVFSSTDAKTFLSLHALLRQLGSPPEEAAALAQLYVLQAQGWARPEVMDLQRLLALVELVGGTGLGGHVQ